MTRQTLALIALTAAVPSVVLQASGVVAEVPSTHRFNPPTTPLVITRTVWRSLYDGKQIVARRSYLVTFAPQDHGFTVSGDLIASEIEAPPALEALAQIERSRPDTGTFPLRLDALGMIRSSGASAPAASFTEGREAARALLAGAALDPAERREADAFLIAVTTTGSTIPWPADLFNPARANSSERREVVLPDGSTGVITVTSTVAQRHAGDLPLRYQREVVTELNGTHRVNREEWTIGPRQGP